MNPQDTRLIHCYDFVSFVVELEKAVRDGYSLDLHTISHYPQQIGFQFIATVVKQDSNVVQETSEVKPESEKEEKEVLAVVTEVATPEASTEVTPVVEAPAEAPKKAAGRPAKAK